MTDSIRSAFPRYGRAPRDLIRDPDRTDAEVRLFVILDDYSDGDGKAFPSRSTIAKAMGCSVNKVDATIRRLVEAGWLVKTQRPRTGERHESTLYTIVCPGVGPAHGAQVGPAHGEGWAPPTGPEGEPPKKNQKKTPPSPPEGEAAPPKRPTRGRQLPDDFAPTDDHFALALSRGVNLVAEIDHFRSYHLAHGSKMKDWDQALRTWIYNAAKWRRSTPSASRASDDVFDAEGRTAYDRAAERGEIPDGGVLSLEQWKAMR